MQTADMKYFTIGELCRSDTARQKMIDNTPGDAERRNLTELVENVLDPLREAWGRPLSVNSGFRCPALNKAVGGKPSSQHLTGHAADITTGSVADNIRLFRLAQRLNLPFDQLIDEHGYAWLHISHDPKRDRRQVLHI